MRFTRPLRECIGSVRSPRVHNTTKRTIHACNARHTSILFLWPDLFADPSMELAFSLFKHASSITVELRRTLRARCVVRTNGREGPSCLDDLHEILATPPRPRNSYARVHARVQRVREFHRAPNVPCVRSLSRRSQLIRV